MSSAWRLAFLVSHIVQWVFIVCLVKDYAFVDRALYEQISGKGDAFAIAMQIGRFDFATLLLSVLGITLTLAGIFGFIEVRSRSEAVATNAAKTTAAIIARDVAEQEIRPEARRIVEEYFDFKGIDLDKLPKKSDGIDDDENQALADSLTEQNNG